MGGILVSIPVHEAPDVIADQVANIHRFVPDSTVVLHVSDEFRTGLLRKPAVIEAGERLLINPERFSTKKEGLTQLHLSNYCYAAPLVDPDWFVINASNDMYVRHGLAEHLARYDAFARPVPLDDKSPWAHTKATKKHDYLQRLVTKLGIGVHVSTPEGTAYPAALMDEFVTELTTTPYARSSVAYPDEETVLPTMLAARDLRVGLPFVLSEVTAGQPLTTDMIDAVRAGTFVMPPKVFYGSGDARPAYGEGETYAVKRVPRVIDHPLRNYIRSLP